MKVHVTRKTVVVALIAGLTLFALAQAKHKVIFRFEHGLGNMI